MSSPENTAEISASRSIDLDARPDRITAGGIVLLVAELSDPGIEEPTDYAVAWEVRGPVRLSDEDTQVALLGASTTSGERVTLQPGGAQVLRATLDTAPLAVGSWQVGLRLRSDEGRTLIARPATITVAQRPFAAGDDVSVTLRRASVEPTADQALWVAIRRSTERLSFENYHRFLEYVLCENPADLERGAAGRVARRTALPFPNVERYRLLKAATEIFLMVNCGTPLDDFRGVDLADESRRLGRPVDVGDLAAQFRSYLVRTDEPDGDHLRVLPYLGLIRQRLGDVAVVREDDEATRVCYGILAEKLTNPCFLELIWSYWLEESGMTRTLQAISWRFQNRSAGRRGRDPLAGMNIDPLRAMSSLLWGWVEDQQHRLTTARRVDEYRHLYGVPPTRPGERIRSADTRSRFFSAFAALLAACETFHARDDDTTVIADGFEVLNALKEVHLLLSQGAHNQYGDLPWTARHEMLMTQWLLSRSEVKDFLPQRIMVAYPEAWMGPVETMNDIQGWDEGSVVNFRDLAVFGEQLLLSIRFGAWTTVNEAEQAANWARYFRQEIKRVKFATDVVTGGSAAPTAHARSNGHHDVRDRRRNHAYGG